MLQLRHNRTPILGLGLVCLLGGANAVASDGAEEKFVGARYDLSSLAVDTPRSVHVPGITDLVTRYEDYSDHQQQPLVDMETWMGLIQQFVDPEVWETGARLEAHGTTLIAFAPESTQRELATLVGLLERSLCWRARFEVSVFVGRSGIEGSTLLSAAEADRRLASLEEEGRLQRIQQGGFSLDALSLGEFREQRERQLHVSSEAEIAQGIAGFQPKVMSFATGLVVAAAGRADEDGAWLQLALHSSRARPARELRVGVTSMLGSSGGVDLREDTTVLELPEDDFYSLCTSLHLPHGHCLWLPMGEGEDSTLVEIRSRTEQGVAPVQVEDLEGPLSLCVFRAGAGLADHLRGPREPAGLSLREDLRLDDSQVSGAQVRLRGLARTVLEDADRTIRWLHDIDDGLEYRFREIAGHYLMVIPDDKVEAVASTVRSSSAGGPRFFLDLRLEDGARRLHYSFPIVDGMPTGLWAGRHLRVLERWDVDVATSASVSKPQVESVMDGLFLSFLPIHADGGVSLTIRGRVNLLLAEPRQKAVGRSDSRTIELCECRSARISQRVELRPGRELRLPGNLGMTLKLRPIAR